MPEDFSTAMTRARDLVRAGKPQEATRLIQATLAGQSPIDITPDPVTQPRPRMRADMRPEIHIDPASVPDAELAGANPADTQPDARPARTRRPLGDVISGLTKSRPRKPRAMSAASPANDSIATGARFDSRRIDTPQGSRDYRLYVPSRLPDGAQGLVIMLHGCTQDPDDFASGTAMNHQAEAHGLILAYPAQTRSHNAQGCWNWFRTADQHRDKGEPALLAALARTLAAEFAVAPDRIFAAGLSAGGAMAAILGQTYPDVFSAIAIHSGLAAGSASDVMSAFAAMRGDAVAAAPQASRADAKAGTPRTITFHGTADSTVHPDNSAQIMAAARDTSHKTQVTSGTANGRSFARSRTLGPDGTVQTEHWEIAGAGHAWSGGSPTGSYTDAKGPDASALMTAFFLGTAAKGT